MSYRFAPGVELVAARSGPALLGWSPLRLVTLNAPLAKLVRRGGGLGDIVPETPAAARALDALLRRGVLVREPSLGNSAELPSVSIVIPVKDRAAELRRCLESVQRLQYPQD